MSWGPTPPAAEMREQILAILLDADGRWLSSQEVADRLAGDKTVEVRQRPGPYGVPCCPGCTDPTHVRTYRVRYDAQAVRPHLKALEREGLIICAGKHAGQGQAAMFYWWTSDAVVSGSPHAEAAS